MEGLGLSGKKHMRDLVTRCAECRYNEGLPNRNKVYQGDEAKFLFTSSFSFRPPSRSL